MTQLLYGWCAGACFFTLSFKNSLKENCLSYAFVAWRNHTTAGDGAITLLLVMALVCACLPPLDCSLTA